MIDYYGANADYIHLKWGDMRKKYNFTDRFREKHPTFCKEYQKYLEGSTDGIFQSALHVAQYVDMFDIPVKFYYNYDDEPSKSIEDVYEYIIRECAFGKFVDGSWVGKDGEKANQKEYKVTKVEEE